MTRITRTTILAVMACFGLSIMAQNITFHGVYQTSRDDDYPNGVYSEYVGWNYTLQKAIFIVQQGLYKMEWNGSTLTMPEKDPAVNKADFYSNGQFTDDAKALWAANFNMMYANSGAIIADGILTTVMSRTDMQNPDGTWVTNDTTRFAVRKWDAQTGDLISSEIRPAWDCLESAGMAVNPKDGKVYGLFHITNKYLPDSILNDPDFFAEESADSTDSGYAICTIDLDKMEISQITPGLYYENFVTFAINSEGRAFALTSGGGTAAEPAEDGKLYDINGQLSGSHLYEFDLQSGLMIADQRAGTGYSSQIRRQAACFSKDDPNKMYWMGYYNSGMGFDDWGNWNPLSDLNWKANRKYDTSFYEVDITTGEGTRLANVADRYLFAYMWVEGEEDMPTAGLRGDVNMNNEVTIADVTALIDYLLSGDATGISLDNADCNLNTDVTIADATALIDYLLSGQW